MSKALVALVNPGVPKEVQHLNQVKPRWKRVGMKAFRQHLRHGCGSLSSCQEIVFTHTRFFFFFTTKKNLAKYRYCDEEKKPPSDGTPYQAADQTCGSRTYTGALEQ